MHLEGRVFKRYAEWEALPSPIKNDVMNCADYLVKQQKYVFTHQRSSIVKSVWGVRGSGLLHHIADFLNTNDKRYRSAEEQAYTKSDAQLTSEPQAKFSSTSYGSSDFGQHEESKYASTKGSFEPSRSDKIAQPAEAGDEVCGESKMHKVGHAAEDTLAKFRSKAKPAAEKAKVKSKAATRAMKAHIAHPKGDRASEAEVAEHKKRHEEMVRNFSMLTIHEKAQQVAYSLILMGFLTFVTDEDIETLPAEHAVKENDLLIPVTPEACMFKTTTVWSLFDGAVFAGWVKRKGGMLSNFTEGKDIYLVASSCPKMIAMFDSDLSLSSKAEWDCHRTRTNVKCDASFYDFGVRIWNGEEQELVNGKNKHFQEVLVGSLVAAGAHYGESDNDNENLELEKLSKAFKEDVQSFYDLVDYKIGGGSIPMTNYKDMIVVVINVPCHDEATIADQWKALSEIKREFPNGDIQILLFPSDEFCCLETFRKGKSKNREKTKDRTSPDFDINDVSKILSKYNCNFEVFRVGNVNGPSTRDVYRFLKAHLHGKFGGYVRDNFTKFLVDRHGVPIKRFEPNDSPNTLRASIRELLVKKPTEPQIKSTESEDEVIFNDFTTETRAPHEA